MLSQLVKRERMGGASGGNSTTHIQWAALPGSKRGN